MDDHSDDRRRPLGARMEIFTGSGRRRWSDAEKAQIVADSLKPDAVVTHVAHRHGCRPQQVHDWRKRARLGLLTVEGVTPDVTTLQAPLIVPLIEAASRPSLREGERSGEIVVEFAGAIVRVRGRPCAGALSDTLTALALMRRC